MLALLSPPVLRRGWQRVLQTYGWKPFAVLALIGLVFANVLDRQANVYDTLSRKSDKQSRELQRMKRKVQEQAQLDTRLEQRQQLLTETLTKHYTQPSPDAAAQQLKSDVEALTAPSKTRLTGGSVLPAAELKPGQTQPVMLVRAESQIGGFTQYLLQFLDQTGKLPRKVWVSELQLAVNDPNQPTELTGKAVYEAVYVGPEKKGEPAAQHSGTPSGKPAARSKP